MPKLSSAIFSSTAPNANKKGESKICLSMTPEKFAELVLSLKHTNLNGDIMDSFESFLEANETRYQAIKGLAKLIKKHEPEPEPEPVIADEAEAVAEPEIDNLSTTSGSSCILPKVKITVHAPIKKEK